MPVGRFGKFVLLQRIGGGRLSQVFRVGADALNPETPSPIALKRVNPALVGEPAFVQLVVREAGLLTRLDHGSLCTCHELGVIDGCPFLTLDLVSGCTLRALMRRISQSQIPLPATAVLAIGYGLAEVLDYLHARCPTPVVHLDLSPQNVMLTDAGTIRLIDFGIARFLDGHEPPPTGERIAGTIGYMSPEQARGEALDARADQYALGILLYELLAGRRLFRGNTTETWRRMRAGEITDLSITLAETPADLRALVGRLLSPAPDARFASMAEALGALERCSSSPLSGQRPLSALLGRLLGDESFDPFDTRLPVETLPEVPADLPRGESAGGEGYEDLRIEVDHGAGTPGGMVRELVVSRSGELPAYSPFLEPGELEAEAEAAAAG